MLVTGNNKAGQLTEIVIADDRSIEKKDRGVAEAIQFYTWRDHLLYEVVISTTGNDGVTGCLSTPKLTTIAAAN